MSEQRLEVLSSLSHAHFWLSILCSTLMTCHLGWYSAFGCQSHRLSAPSSLLRDRWRARAVHPPAWIILFNGVWIFPNASAGGKKKSGKWVLEICQELQSSGNYGFVTCLHGPCSVRDRISDNGHYFLLCGGNASLECCPLLYLSCTLHSPALNECEFIPVGFKPCSFVLWSQSSAVF